MKKEQCQQKQTRLELESLTLQINWHIHSLTKPDHNGWFNEKTFMLCQPFG